METKFLDSYIKFTFIIEPLIPFMDNGDLCTKQTHTKISTCKFSILESIRNFIFNQKSYEIINPSYCTYLINCFVNHYNSKTEFYTSYQEKFNKDFSHTIIQRVDNNIVLNTLSVNSMSDYIKLNESNQFIFIPVSLSPPYCKDKTLPGHACCLIIDNFEHCVYFFDPNGWTTFFDEQLPIKIDEKLIYLRYTKFMIEKLFEKYFSDVGSYLGITYKFIPSSQWNPRNLALNKKFTGSQVDYGGNCVGFTILFFHYLILTKKSIRTCAEDLNSLEDQYKIQLINDYSVWLSNQIDFAYNLQKEEIINDHKKKISDIFDKINLIDDNLIYDDNLIQDNINYDPVKFELEFNANKEKSIIQGIQTEITEKINSKDINYNFTKKNILSEKYFDDFDNL